MLVEVKNIESETHSSIPEQGRRAAGFVQRQEDGHLTAVQIRMFACNILLNVVQGSQLIPATGSVFSELVGRGEGLGIREALTYILPKGNYLLRRFQIQSHLAVTKFLILEPRY